MSLLQPDETAAVEAVARLLDCNPFLPERVDLERRILGRAFVDAGPHWHSEGDEFVSDPNRPLLCDRVEALAASVRERLATGAVGSDAELDAYRGLILYLLWLRYEDDLYALLPPADGGVATANDPVPWFDSFERDAQFFLAPLPGPPADVPHLFAFAFQARRAFDYIFRRLFGGSLPAARLRAAVWQSIFTADMHDYRHFDYDSMRDSPTLITGESGTGKDLVACAIGMSQYIPFDPTTRRFVDASQARYFAVNPSALSPTLIESELFGHERGAFTDAVAARAGWFESCGPYGAIFLDEIGELAAVIQVKLLRLLHNRRFERIGDTTSRSLRFSQTGRTRAIRTGGGVTHEDPGYLNATRPLPVCPAPTSEEGRTSP